jgi:O-antigen/teichoic acid export membrane protein
MLRGVLFNWGSLVIGAGVSIVLTPAMIRGLGQYYYGLWVLVMSIADQYGLLDLGITPALSRFAGYFKGSEQRDALDEMFSCAFLLTLVISLVICVLTGPLAAGLPGFFGIAAGDRPIFVRLVLMLGVTTAIAFPERMLAAYLRGIQRFDLFNLAATGSTLVRGALIVLALSFGWKILGIAAITLATGIVSLGVNYLMVRLADPDLRVRGRHLSKARLRELLGFSAYAFVTSLGTRIIARVDSIVIGRILSVGMIAPFNIASRMTDYFVGLFAGIHGPVLSAMSELDGAGKHEELRALFLRTSRYTFLLSGLIASLLLVNGRAVLQLWLGTTGLDLDLTYRVLVVLTICYAVNQSQLPSWSVIYARARHRLLAWLTLAEGAVNLLLSVYWGRKYGLIGIALGTTVPAVIHHLLIVPAYALRVAGIRFTAYMADLWRPAALGVLFAILCRFTYATPVGLMPLLVRVAVYSLVLGFLAYAAGLTRNEKAMLIGRLRGGLTGGLKRKASA